MYKTTTKKEQSMFLNLLIILFKEQVNSKSRKGKFLVLIFKLNFLLL